MLTSPLQASTTTGIQAFKSDAVQAVQHEAPITVDKAAMREAIVVANKAMQSLERGLEFSVDAESGEMLVRVIDRATRQVIRQIPSEEMLAIARALDRMRGLLVNHDA
jgi:flagellar protein FlaG